MVGKNEVKMGEGKVSIGVGVFANLFEKVLSLSDTVVKMADPLKFAESVNKLHEGTDKTYADMRKMVMESEQFSDEDKFNRLMQIAEMETATKERLAKTVENDREKIADVANDVFKNITHCAINALPEFTDKVAGVVEENFKGLNAFNVVDSEVVSSDK